MSDIRRVLVTGSRTWNDEQQIAGALLETLHNSLADGADGILVVHGARPHGPDAQAAEWCAAHDIAAEAHPADRETHGNDADYIRDRHMVAAGADVCLVFVAPCTSGKCRRPKPHNSHDANACAALAADAGIPVRRWTT
ncbi:SLOG family protein [Streptomyces ovatisporus]|uniref:SLOG family protein n=1 Tax=Streptomyces ovatisporus TaxID=1128682 RepID=A0ABV9A7I3_9ACTN